MKHGEQDIPATGRFVGMPYDWRKPSLAHIRARAWNPRDRRLLTPKTFGWGYDVNHYELMARVGIERRR